MSQATLSNSFDFDAPLVDFDAAWRRGEEPDIAQCLSAYLDPTPAEDNGVAATNQDGDGASRRIELLAELVMIDLEYRWRQDTKRSPNDRQPPSRETPNRESPNRESPNRESPSHDSPNREPQPGQRSAEDWASNEAPLPRDRPRLEDYVRRFPELGPLDRIPVDLIGQEYRVRQRWGDQPGHDQYVARFPAHERALREMLDRIDAELTTEARRSLPADRTFGHYQLLAVLGEGGMGTVYRALDTRLAREVAVKMIRSGRLATPTEVARFHDEAETAAQLDHPHIVPIYEVGEFHGQHYFSMKLIAGADLTQELPRMMLDLPRAVRLVTRVAHAVHYAHQRGVLHRDLKPGNILLDVQGNPHVGDFGLARRLDGESVLTQTGAIVGTPSYMAPEQATGSSDRRNLPLTTATDVYGLGAILYTLITGRAPFRGDSPLDVQRQVVEQDPELPRAVNPIVDRDLETVTLKCLDKDPARRYESAVALADDLERWLRHEPIRARRLSPTARAWRWCRRRPLVASLWAAVAVLLVAVAIGAPIVAVQRAYIEGTLLNLERVQYLSTLSEIRRLRLSETEGWSDPAQTLFARGVERGIADEDLAEFRSEFVATLDTLDARRIAIFDGGQGDVESVGFAGDDTLVAAGAGGNAKLWDLSEFPTAKADGKGKLARLTRPRGDVSAATQTPPPQQRDAKDAKAPATGRARVHARGIVSFASSDGVVVRRMVDGNWNTAVIVKPPAAAAAKGVGIDPQCRRVAVAWTDGKVVVYDVADGKPVRTIGVELLPSQRAGGAVATIPVALSPDTQRVAVVHRGREVRLYDLQTAVGDEDKFVRAAVHRNFVTAMVFSPDGKMLATASDDYTAKLIDLVRRDDPTTLKQHLGPVNGVAFSPDGRWVATASHDGTVRLWLVRTGGCLRVLRPELDAALSVAFSPNGQYLAIGGGLEPESQVAVLYRLSGREVRRRLEGHEWASVAGLALHRGGKAFATAAGDQEVVFWDAESEKPARMLPPFARRAIVSIALAPRERDLLAVAPRDVIVPSRDHPQNDYAICLWDWPTGKTPRVLDGHRANVEASAFDSTGEQLATGDVRGVTYVWDVDAGAPKRRWEAAYGAVVGAAFVDDDANVLTAYADGRLLVRRVADGGTERQSAAQGKITCFAVAPDRRQFVVGGEDGQLRLYDAAKLAPVDDANGEPSAADAPPTHGEKVTAVAFSADGGLVASAAGRVVTLWDIRRQKVLLTLPTHDAPVFNVGFLPDGSRLVVCGREDLVTIWDLRMIRRQLREAGLDW